MKNIITFIFISLILLSSTQVFAEQDTTLDLTLPLGFEQSICKTKIWSGINVIWNGVKDERENKSVATVYNKKGEELYTYNTLQPLTAYFDQYIPKLLGHCGLNFVKKNEPHTYTLTAIINNFSANMDKSLVKSKTSAEGRLSLNFDMDYSNVDVKVAYLMDNKGAAFKSKKQLQKMLTELLHGTIAQLIESGQINFLER